MILISVVGIWLGIVAIAVSVDVGTAYRAEKAFLKEGQEEESVDEIQEIRDAIARYREAKRNELGDVYVIGQHPAPVRKRPHGSHRKLKAAS